jgi:hypothetical protein
MPHPLIDGLAYYEIEFDEAGGLINDDGLLTDAESGKFDDIFIMAHGWNTSAGSAENLYQAMFGLLAAQLPGRVDRCAAVGVIWPALLFPEDDPKTATATASTGKALAAALSPAFPTQTDALDRMGTLLDTRPQDPDRLTEFHQLAASLVTSKAGETHEDSGENAAITGDTATVFGFFSALAKQPPAGGQGQALANPFSPLWDGAREVLRTLSYYEMKNRAGVVGETGLGPLLGKLVSDDNTPRARVHLSGHSFGARLVSFALRPLPAGPATPVKSLLLIQAAFSHFSFAAPLPLDPARNGALADRRDRVDGPLLATFSAADRALGWWYPTASMLSHQDSQARDDLTYRWGAIGHDGYQQPGVIDHLLLAAKQPYVFVKNHFYRLDANDVISADQSPVSGAHSDIRHPEILWAAISAAGLA